MSVVGPVSVAHMQMEEFKRLYDKGHFPTQRFGQAFCNHFNIVWPEVFYITARKDAERLIYCTVK